jgi:4'-phosphopantetheinyl transferase EntD
LPVEDSWMATAALGWPFRRLEKLYVSAPTSRRATSRKRTVEPSALARRTIAEFLDVRELALDQNGRGQICWVIGFGRAPIWPAATWAFWAPMRRC